MNFLLSPLKLIKKIGYSLGSSLYLARALVKASQIRGKSGLHILELGSGNSIVTREILGSLGENSNFKALEYEEKYIPGLRTLSDGTFEVIHDNATQIGKYIEDNSLDVIISTLPLASHPLNTVENILKAIKKALKPGGIYIQYQYFMQNKKDIERYFHIEKINIEPRNFTPAFIYITHKE